MSIEIYELWASKLVLTLSTVITTEMGWSTFLVCHKGSGGQHFIGTSKGEGQNVS